jgi:hypothetical protein
LRFPSRILTFSLSLFRFFIILPPSSQAKTPLSTTHIYTHTPHSPARRQSSPLFTSLLIASIHPACYVYLFHSSHKLITASTVRDDMAAGRQISAGWLQSGDWKTARAMAACHKYIVLDCEHGAQISLPGWKAAHRCRSCSRAPFRHAIDMACSLTNKSSQEDQL